MDSTVKASFWTDNRVEEITPDQKLALLWLITNPSRDLLGFSHVTTRRFCFETGLPDLSPLQGACKALPSSFQVVTAHIYFARNFLRHQFGKGGMISMKNKVMIPVLRHARTLPSPLQGAFLDAYPEWQNLIIEETKIDPPPIPLPRGREEKRREEQRDSSNFLPDIVALYPKRERQTEAVEALAQHVRKGTDLDAVASGTRAIAAVIARLPGGHLNAFVPSAAVFFRNRRWEDDPNTWLRNAGKHTNGAPQQTLDLGGRRPAANSRTIECE